MENFSYPIRLEPLDRTRRKSSPAPAAARTLSTTASPRKQKTTRAGGPPSPGLREMRERHGVSLEQIAEETRIPLRHLQELERGDVSHWPAGVYARSWARDYATRAGIDPDRVIGIVQPIAEVEPTIEEIKQVTEERERSRVDGLMPLTPLVQLMRKVAAVVVVLVLLVLAVMFFWDGESRPDTPAPVGTSGVTPATPGQAPR